jgi:hypothetical protein
MVKLKIQSTLALIVGFAVLGAASVALAEPPQYRELDRDGPNGRWEADQYRRADRMDQQGEHQKAQEVREYAHERADAVRGATDAYRENARGPGE